MAVNEQQKPVVHWFRNDLRLADNAALSAAVKSGLPLVALYVLDDETPGQWAAGGASRWWLHHSLKSLEQALRQRGGSLILRRGSAVEVVPKVAAEANAAAVYWTRGYEPHAQQTESALHDSLSPDVEVRRFGGALLFQPEHLHTGSGEPYRVFTPFWKACLRGEQPREPLPVPKLIQFHSAQLFSERLEDFALLPVRPDWAGGLRESWQPGEDGAQDRLSTFLSAPVDHYPERRDRPDRQGTSRLSPHLHFGEISPHQVWHAAQGVSAGETRAARGASAFIRQLGWREFSYHLLHHWPDLPEAPFRPVFSEFPWRRDEQALRAWQRGKTGYPIVDAGMRELWHTGWMHNRVRMLVASVLVKHLLIPWQDGEAWFWDTLVDADLANNAAGWQWVAGCGADAAPYFRVFNPMLQGEKFDPEGSYVRRWVPELGKLPSKHIHAPWDAPAAVLQAAGVKLGKSYPLPIVEHSVARKEALAAYAQMKEA